jgi:hypothetical protein
VWLMEDWKGVLLLLAIVAMMTLHPTGLSGRVRRCGLGRSSNARTVEPPFPITTSAAL